MESTATPTGIGLPLLSTVTDGVDALVSGRINCRICPVAVVTYRCSAVEPLEFEEAALSPHAERYSTNTDKTS